MSGGASPGGATASGGNNPPAYSQSSRPRGMRLAPRLATGPPQGPERPPRPTDPSCSDGHHLWVPGAILSASRVSSGVTPTTCAVSTGVTPTSERETAHRSSPTSRRQYQGHQAPNLRSESRAQSRRHSTRSPMPAASLSALSPAWFTHKALRIRNKSLQIKTVTFLPPRSRLSSWMDFNGFGGFVWEGLGCWEDTPTLLCTKGTPERVTGLHRSC